MNRTQLKRTILAHVERTVGDDVVRLASGIGCSVDPVRVRNEYGFSQTDAGRDQAAVYPFAWGPNVESDVLEPLAQALASYPGLAGPVEVWGHDHPQVGGHRRGYDKRPQVRALVFRWVSR
jgi:hypothetical protein